MFNTPPDAENVMFVGDVGRMTGPLVIEMIPSKITRPRSQAIPEAGCAGDMTG